MNIKEFMEIEKIAFTQFNYFLTDKDNKKIPLHPKNPFGDGEYSLEKSNQTIEQIEKRNKIKFNYDIDEYKNVKGEYIKLSETELNSRRMCYCLFLKYTDNIYCVDIDDKDISSMDDFINKTGISVFEQCPWVRGKNKGIHIYIKINGDYKKYEGNKVFQNFEGDFLKHANCIWECVNAKVENYDIDDGVPVFEFDEDLKKLFKVENNDVVKNDVVIDEVKTEIKNQPNDDLSIQYKKSEMKFYINEAIKYKMFQKMTGTDKWIKLLYIIKNLFGDNVEGENLFIDLSRHDPKFNFDEVKYKYRLTKSENQRLTIGTLKQYLKDVDKPNYDKINFDWNLKANEDNLKDIIICNTDAEASNHFYNEYKDIFKSFQGRLFYLNDNIWICDDLKINNVLLNNILHSNVHTMNDKGKIMPFAQNVTRAEKILKALISKIKVENDDEDLYLKFHNTTRSKVFFNDGFLDFENRRFYTWDEANNENIKVYPTLKINRDYKQYYERAINNDEKINQDIDDIDNNIIKNLFGEKKEQALHFLSRALAGHSGDKRWATYQGNRNCGKGVIYELLEGGFEKYVQPFDVKQIMYARKSQQLNEDCAKKLYWVLELEFARLAISQEVPEAKAGRVLNSEIFKKLAGGNDWIKGKLNYDRKDTTIKLDTSFFMFGNDELISDIKDNDNTRISFQSVVQFVGKDEYDEIKKKYGDTVQSRYKLGDRNIKTKCNSEDWKNAIVFMIYQNYKNHEVQLLNKDNEDNEDNNLFNLLVSKFEPTQDNNDIILCDDIYNELEDFDKKTIIGELKNMNIFKTKYEKKGKDAKLEFYKKQVFTNIKRIEKKDD